MTTTEAEPVADASQAKVPKAASPWPPVIAVVLLMPVMSWAVTQFFILPRMRGVLAEQQVLAAAGKPAEHAEPKDAKHSGSVAGKFSYDFDNIVVNLSGAMGTRYLKTSFTIFSANPELKKLVEENKKQLLDVALGVLSSHTLADLEAEGAKNVVRNSLTANFNQALGSDLVEQIYFSEFVVQ